MINKLTIILTLVISMLLNSTLYIAALEATPQFMISDDFAIIEYKKYEIINI